MIGIEANSSPFRITNDQFATVMNIVALDWALDYDLVEHDEPGMDTRYVYLYVHPEAGNATRYHIGLDGDVLMTEEVDWDQGVGAPTHEGRVDLSALYPYREGETSEAWTDRVLSHAREHGTNRQCSIGWHEECSDPAGESCRCLCHGAGVGTYSVEGHAEGGTVTVTRTVRGKVAMPPIPGEPATAWAEWVLATSAEDAAVRAVKKQEAKDA